MPTSTKHSLYELNAPIARTGKMPQLRAAVMLELLAKSGARQNLARAHPPVARDVNTARNKQSRVLTYPELKLMKGIGYSRQHLERLEKAGNFPNRVRISEARIGWLESEVDEWLGQKADARAVKKV